MAKNNNLGDFLTDIANSIRTKTGGTSPINAQDFSTEIANIPTGSSFDYTITFNVDGIDYGEVNVDSGTQITQTPFSPTKAGNVFAGWSLTSGGAPITYPYLPISDTTLYAIFLPQLKAIVEGLGSSSPSSVVFTVDSSFSFNFDEVVIDGNTFIKIPTMYRKVDTVVSSQITKFTISNAQIDNTYQPYPCFLDESGNLLDYILIGKYWISSTTVANSVNATASTMTIGNGRTLCRAKTDSTYVGQLYDWQIHQLWKDLIICAKRTVNTNSGTAWTTDELGIYWGTRGCWIDGLIGDSNTIRFSYKPSAYVDEPTSSTTDYNTVNYTMPSGTSGANITKLGYDSSHPFVNMPSSASGTSYTTYYCDAYYGGGTFNRPFAASVGYASAGDGAYNSSFIGGWTGAGACRLCLRPIA